MCTLYNIFWNRRWREKKAAAKKLLFYWSIVYAIKYAPNAKSVRRKNQNNNERKCLFISHLNFLIFLRRLCVPMLLLLLCVCFLLAHSPGAVTLAPNETDKKEWIETKNQHNMAELNKNKNKQQLNMKKKKRNSRKNGNQQRNCIFTQCNTNWHIRQPNNKLSERISYTIAYA